MFKKYNDFWVYVIQRLGLLLFVLFTVPAHARIVHIAPSGNDNTGNGTVTSPYHSPHRAEDDIMAEDTIYIHGGRYTSTDDYWGILDNMIGAPGQWITIMGAPGEERPVLDGVTIWVTTQYKPAGTITNHLRIKGLDITNSTGAWAGISIDDGGTWRRQYPTHHIEVSDIDMYNLNYVGLKLAGVDSFTVRDVNYDSPNNTNYPGVGIDCVGCHDGIIEECSLTNLGYQCQERPEWFSSAFHIKGGVRNITIRRCYVENVYAACLIGQLTGEDFFRPPFGELDADGEVMNYEAKEIKYYSNIIVNASVAVSFSNSREGKFYNNTVYCPINNGDGDYNFSNFVKLYAFRNGSFVKNGATPIRDRNGEVKNNVVVFGKPVCYSPDDCIVWCQNDYNNFSTFEFENNLLYCIWNPEMSEPDWDWIIYADGPPTRNDNIYGQDPLYVNAPGRIFNLNDGSPAIDAGQHLPLVLFDYYGYGFDSSHPSLGAIQYGDPETPASVSAPIPKDPLPK